MKRVAQLFCPTILLFLGVSAAAQGLSSNLVQNGSFEWLGQNVSLPPWHNGYGRPPAVPIAVLEQWRTPEGSNFIVATSAICQDVPTVAGRPYLFRFAFGGNDRAQVNSGPLHVSWDNRDVVTIPITRVDSRYLRWRYFDFVVLAQSNTTRIAFSPRGAEAFPYLDDVQVTAVPSEWMVLPQSQSAEEGAAVIFRLKTVSSIQDSTFQWLFAETNALVGETNTFLQLTNIQPEHAGLYSVIVSNSALVVTGAPAQLSIIPSVKKRTVPVLWAAAYQNGTLLHFESADSPGGRWVPLVNIAQSNGRLSFVDCSTALPEQRLYRVWTHSEYRPSLWIDSTTAIHLSGSVGSRWRIDSLNAIGPPDAWQPLDTVALTNSTQLYYSEALLGKVGRLYRVVPVP